MQLTTHAADAKKGSRPKIDRIKRVLNQELVLMFSMGYDQLSDLDTVVSPENASGPSVIPELDLTTATWAPPNLRAAGRTAIII